MKQKLESKQLNYKNILMLSGINPKKEDTPMPGAGIDPK